MAPVSHRLRTALFYQDGNFVGREYFAHLAAGGQQPNLLIAVGKMTTESATIEHERTAGRWSPPEIPRNLSIRRVSQLDDPAIVDLIAEQSIDVAIQAGVGLIREPLLSAPAFGFVNVHPGALPAYRGSACPEWAILENTPVVLTAHRIDAGLDTGPVLFSRTMRIDPDWEYFDFRSNLYEHCAEVLVDALRQLETTAPAKREALLLPQPVKGGRTLKRMGEEDTARVRASFAGWATRMAVLADNGAMARKASK